MTAVGVVIWPPLAALFVAMPWQLLFGVSPVYWPGRVYWSALEGDAFWALWVIPGLAWQGLLVWQVKERLVGFTDSPWRRVGTGDLKYRMSGAICLGALLWMVRPAVASNVDVVVSSPVDVPLEATFYLEEFSDPLLTSLRDKRMIGTVTLPWQGTVEVPENTPSRLEVRGPGFWCTTDELGVETGVESPEPVGCQMVPAGEITGRLQPSPAPDSPPRFLRLTFQTAKVKEKVSSEAKRSSELVFCDVEETRFECPLPAGTMNIRMALEGYGAQYLWRKEITTGSTKKLGRLRFEKGTSVAGAVVVRSGSDAPDATVELKPRVAARDSYRSDERALELYRVTAPVDREGGFVLLGVENGEYDLIASAADSCATELRVRVTAGDSLVHLGDPLVLESCAELEVFVEPAADFGGESWSLKLLETTGNVASVVETAAVALDGSAAIDELKAGIYELEVRDHEGDTWWSRDIDVYAGMSPLFVEIGAVRVRGAATRGTEPIDGELIFGTRNRRPSVSMKIDEEGSFEGYLPFEGEWALELDRGGHHHFLDAVNVEVPAGKSHAEIEVSLPDTLVKGKVVEDGKAVEGAVVVVLRDAGRLEKELFATSDEDGEFVFSGMRAGDLRLRAAFGRLQSEWRFLALKEGDEIEEVELELATTVAVRGRVSVHGTGVPGARIVGFPSKAAGNLLATGGATAADGSFDVKVTRDAQRLDLAVLPSGHEALLALAQPAVGGTEWPALELQLQGASGTVVLRAEDPSASVTVSFGGAVLPFRIFMNLMEQEARVDHQRFPGIALHGLAAGTWTFCQQAAQAHCVSTDLFPGAVVTVDLLERTSE